MVWFDYEEIMVTVKNQALAFVCLTYPVDTVGVADRWDGFELLVDGWDWCRAKSGKAAANAVVTSPLLLI